MTSEMMWSMRSIGYHATRTRFPRGTPKLIPSPPEDILPRLSRVFSLLFRGLPAAKGHEGAATSTAIRVPHWPCHATPQSCPAASDGWTLPAVRVGLDDARIMTV